MLSCSRIAALSGAVVAGIVRSTITTVSPQPMCLPGVVPSTSSIVILMLVTVPAAVLVGVRLGVALGARLGATVGARVGAVVGVRVAVGCAGTGVAVACTATVVGVT